MQATISGAIVRLHGPLTLQVWDRLTTALGLTFMTLAIPLVLLDEKPAAVAASLGGWAILWSCRHQRRRHLAGVWRLASEASDPVETLALYDYLYRLRFRDLLVLVEWRVARENAGLPVLVDESAAPPQVRRLVAHLRDFPREC